MTYKTRFLFFSAAAFCLILTASATAFASTSLDSVPALQLAYGDGDTESDATYSPGLADAGKLKIYWFWSPNSSCSINAEPSITALKEAHPDIEVIVVHSNADQSTDHTRQAATERDLPFDIYRDENARLAIALNAIMTPEVVVVDDSQVIYRGRPISITRRGTQSFVEEVVVAWKKGDAPDTAHRRPTGCVIRRP